jgi:hypothetical protein
MRIFKVVSDKLNVRRNFTQVKSPEQNKTNNNTNAYVGPEIHSIQGIYDL